MINLIIIMNKDAIFKKETFQEISKKQMRIIQGGSYEAWPAKWYVPSDENDS
ncbi:hypothetical protein [Aquimarina algiphila]|uniref:hypothetical protein n=1 Tax=Aquimarina algiphila TaxID=2047982 RepID=UPI0014312EC3|nr:hypothetical protein [Aquimarina algiphila]